MAEKVEKVNSDLVARDTEGKVYTVRYDAANAMVILGPFTALQRAFWQGLF